MARPESSKTDALLDDTVDRVLVASRALVGVAARSLAIADTKVTLPQYRALVLLASRGEQNVSGLADALEIHPSTATRLFDRLFAKGLIERATSEESRREVTVCLTPAGRSLVRTVTQRRKRELRRILEELDPAAQRQMITAFDRFADAASEVPDDAWKLGWTT
jgi:DNA-binding MarR family transcriptional regulator